MRAPCPHTSGRLARTKLRAGRPQHKETMTELPSEPELFAGRMKDGSRPRLRSHELYYHWDKPIPGGVEDRSPMEVDLERLHYRINLNHLRQLDKALAFGEAMVDAGLHALKNAPPEAITSAQTKARGAPVRRSLGEVGNPGRVTVDSQPQADPPGIGIPGSGSAGRPVDACSDVRVPPVPFDEHAKEVGKILDAADKLELEAELACDAGDSTATHAGKLPASQIPLEKLLPLAEKGARLIVMASAKRAELAHILADQAFGLDTRKLFLQDRAVAVVYATLLHLDEQFRDVGFGSWMPFRFPDQWLAFCGIMRRVLAANGLIHSKHADTYRKLLDETPPVEIEGEIEDRIKLTRTPINPARCWENRGAETMADLAERLWHEVDHPPYPPPRKQCAPD